MFFFFLRNRSPPSLKSKERNPSNACVDSSTFFFGFRFLPRMGSTGPGFARKLSMLAHRASRRAAGAWEDVAREQKTIDAYEARFGGETNFSPFGKPKGRRRNPCGVCLILGCTPQNGSPFCSWFSLQPPNKGYP